MQTTRQFAQRAEALRAGDITFDRFVSETRASWRALAIYLMKRWRSPACIEVEDVEQELITEAWAKVSTFDASQGVPFARYLVWNACARAKRFLHRARGVSLHREPDQARSVVPFSIEQEDQRAEHHGSANRFVGHLAVAPKQEDAIDRAHVVTSLDGAPLTEAQTIALAALLATDLSIAGAAVILYQNAETRLACRLGCEGEATRLVRTTIRRVHEVSTRAPRAETPRAQAARRAWETRRKSTAVSA